MDPAKSTNLLTVLRAREQGVHPRLCRVPMTTVAHSSTVTRWSSQSPSTSPSSRPPTRKASTEQAASSSPKRPRHTLSHDDDVIDDIIDESDSDDDVPVATVPATGDSLSGGPSRVLLRSSASVSASLACTGLSVRLDTPTQFDGVLGLVQTLKRSLREQASTVASTQKYCESLQTSVKEIFSRFRIGRGLEESSPGILSKDRSAFVLLGGPTLLLQAIRPPLNPLTVEAMARLNSSSVQHLWMHVILILRDLIYHTPGLCKQVFSTDLCSWLFQLLAHPTTFDASCALLEELLNVWPEALDLSTMPDAPAVLLALSSRQLAQFCRVVALLVFQPEDRRILESAQPVRSLVLLQLRRDRFAHGHSVIETNQAIIYNTPGLLERLLHILRVVNFAPPLADFSFYTGLNHFQALAADLLVRRGSSNEWSDLESLMADSSPSADAQTETFAEESTETASDESSISVMARLFTSIIRPSAGNTGNLMREGMDSSRVRRQRDAREQLKISGILLSHHQIEVLFVLCTLLGGRRKLDVQNRLIEAGLVTVLGDMLPRLSWGAPPRESPMPQIHAGPDCECNPESALRVQFLRVLHNLIDRDCTNEPHKLLLLSTSEHAYIDALQSDPELPLIQESNDSGLLRRIVSLLMQQSIDSVYRFWLSSCVEAFLRGVGNSHKLFLCKLGLLEFLTKQVVDGKGSLQTTFDLLGELALELLEGHLREWGQFDRFLSTMATNLTDSNVFIRALILFTDPPARRHRKGYLRASWRDAPLVPLGMRPLSPDGSPDVTPSSSFLSPDGSLDVTPSSSFLSPDGSPDVTPSSSFLSADAASLPAESVLLQVLRAESASLLAQLMRTAELGSINHENICCLNTAVVLLVLLHRSSPPDGLQAHLRTVERRLEESFQLAYLLPSGERAPAVCGRCCDGGAEWTAASLAQHFRRTLLTPPTPPAPPIPTAAAGSTSSGASRHHRKGSEKAVAAPATSLSSVEDVQRNFRELLWFWKEYYERRGRDRLSLEFSCRIPYAEWIQNSQRALP